MSVEYKSECPICENGNVKVVSEEVTRTYKGKELIIQEYFYRCPQCGYEFTNTEIDEVNVKTTQDAYEKMLDRLMEFMRKRY